VWRSETGMEPISRQPSEHGRFFAGASAGLLLPTLYLTTDYGLLATLESLSTIETRRFDC
jgi:hypothetical protein